MEFLVLHCCHRHDTNVRSLAFASLHPLSRHVPLYLVPPRARILQLDAGCVIQVWFAFSSRAVAMARLHHQGHTRAEAPGC